MSDKKKKVRKVKKVVKKKKSPSPKSVEEMIYRKKKKGEKAPAETKVHKKVTAYSEAKSRRDKTTVEKKSFINVSKNTKYLAIVGFFLVSFIASKYFLASFLKPPLIVTQSPDELKCEDEFNFTPIEKKILAISAFVEKPKLSNQYVSPCDDKLNSKLVQLNDEATVARGNDLQKNIENLDEQMRKIGKISKLAKDNEDPKIRKDRNEKLKNYTKLFNDDYSRFEISNYFPENALYYGLVTDDIVDDEIYLEARACKKPELYYANDLVSHLTLFFTVNAKRGYQGEVRLINKRYETLIEGKMAIYEYPREPFHRYLPEAAFDMWVHKNVPRDFKGYMYQRQYMSQSYKFGWDRSPWLYNKCGKSIATISNYCGLDARYDMQFKEYFYDLNRDKIIGNIYCKRSAQKNWSRIAIFEFVRTK